MKIENFLAKFFDIEIRDFENPDNNYIKVDGVVKIDIYEKGEDSEPIGWFIHRVESKTFEWCNVYGKIATGTIYDAASLKDAAKANAFLHSSAS